ncbi:mucin-13-like [Periophthalmus magnuspinnatus]|uniref:mucin-13-like n=1 Tax=Periophthalmus magnuspinnatus TaxID=409849 RepID=UPI002436DA02|nr:mucin-13-like [Periophthalmus magnuspinnatus]
MSKYYPAQLNVTSAPLDPVKTTDPQHEAGSDTDVVPVTVTTASHVTIAPSATATTTNPQQTGSDSDAVFPVTVTTASHVTIAPSATATTTNPQKTGSDSDAILPVTITTVSHVTIAPSTTETTTNPQQTGRDSDAILHVTTTVTTVSHVTIAPSATETTTNPQQTGNESDAILPENPKWVILGAVFGVLGSCVILVSTFFCIKWRTANYNNKSSRSMAIEYVNTQSRPVKPRAHMLVEDDDNFYSLITSVPSAHCSTDFAEVMGNQSNSVNESDTYHLYDTIQNEPSSGSVQNILYDSVNVLCTQH